MNWTKEQEEVISLRDCNILVSAAAGSGKTAVLVERILSRVTDPLHPMDIDRLLVVTFTRAAAGEMKERIGKALEEKLRENPENEHLQRQGVLLHHAQISTIHGFCTYVIQNYFHQIDLDPSYRIADEGELKLLKRDVLSDLIEEEYGQGREDFTSFVEAYAPGKTDGRLEDLILRVYEFAISDPWPREWLQRCLEAYRVETEEELLQADWIHALEKEAGRLVAGALPVAEQNLATGEGAGGPSVYIPQLEADLELVQGLAGCRTYQDYYQAFQGLSFAKLSAKKDPQADPQIREQVKQVRQEIKNTLTDIQKEFFSQSPQELLEELALCRPHAETLCRLVLGFWEGFSAAKRSKNLMDFSDLEHFALQILLKRTPQGWERTDAARELSDQYDEIMTDEYQDSNYIQEYLLEAVSGRERGVYNRFMVGDIKQAIYGFRMARPELFLEKYHSYDVSGAQGTHENQRAHCFQDAQEIHENQGAHCFRDAQGEQAVYDSEGSRRSTCRRIDLHQNFRSRARVLDSVNFFFRRLMTEDLGGLVYDDAAALHAGASFPPGQEAPQTELLLMDRKSPEFEDDRSKKVMIETEALAIAQKIKSLMGEMQVVDKKSGTYRPLQYGDCVILLRSATGWADIFLRVLQNEGIPAYSASRSGYFSAIEVVTVLNYLRICDNPRQDIPFTAILRSPMVGCTDRELALIRCRCPEMPMYQAARAYVEETFAESGSRRGANAPAEEELLRQKLQDFLGQLKDLQEMVPYTSVYRLIRQIYAKTGYRSYAAAMPGGEQREANLDMLVEKAVEFEKGSYHGLFQFIRYIEELEKYQVDFGQVNLSGEGADTVRIMTIHKSKGLEFPLVFLAGLGGSFNQSDQRASVALHAGLGIGIDVVNVANRTKTPSLRKQAISQAIRHETLGEELRVLYVALTRAKEKLVLTGLVDDLEKRIRSCASGRHFWRESLPYRQLSGARGYLDWILPALSRSQCFAPLYDMVGESAEGLEDDCDLHLQVLTPAQMTLSQMEEELDRKSRREGLKELLFPAADPAAEASPLPEEGQAFEGSSSSIEGSAGGAGPLAGKGEEIRELGRFLEEKAAYCYPYDRFASMPAKMTVSELKKETQDDQGYHIYEEADVIPLIPKFMQQEPEEMEGATRGTIYHKFFEQLDYGKLEGGLAEEVIGQQIEDLIRRGHLTDQEAGCLNQRDLLHFLQSPLGHRMKAAALEGRLKREQPFTLLLPAGQIRRAWQGQETILVQGVIDAYLEEEGEYVIVDYKTDRVSTADGRDLAEKYRRQLLYYKKALEEASQRRVKEMLIYSVTLGKTIAL